VIQLEAHARNSESGYDYVGVTRFGHRTARISAKNAGALAVQIGGRTIIRKSVRGYHPAGDWASGVTGEVQKLVEVAGARAGGRIAARVGGGEAGVPIQAVIDWAASLLPDLNDPQARPENAWPLPDVAANMVDDWLMPGRVRQSKDRLRAVTLLLAVHPDPHDVASSQLYGFIDTLMDELVNDHTLGGRVAQVERRADGSYAQASFDPAYVDTEDGSRARIAVMSISIRDPKVNV
jgi:hypothetical protein